jgi:hypothetical protein
LDGLGLGQKENAPQPTKPLNHRHTTELKFQTRLYQCR